ncbi:pyridoxamine 5'-phosphate oxidase family protein [Pedobacter sp. SYSU D00535]|uniref:pyridoxamine 5'-phosphate oxidase family protein n=1 Tax=Pedobacter sp. SYSU D00535 TaxID=2810308 RepID=UPI001A968FAC|nr:pyridoxamine 5'-phosphate oxidase family protein [Pedobacter sp. SYSU D00535]
MEKLHGNTVSEQLQEIEQIKKVRELAGKLKDIKIALLTTITATGKPHSRPMYTFELKDDGIIWMFISRESRKVKEIEANPEVVLNYSNPTHDLYVTINGRAEISNNPTKVEELWSDRFKAWFPYGKDDPNLCLLKITPEEAEYWDSPDLLLAQIVNLVKNTFSGNAYIEGENKKIDFTKPDAAPASRPENAQGISVEKREL